MSYIRLTKSNRGNQIVSVPRVDNFREVVYKTVYSEQVMFSTGLTFIAFHHIVGFDSLVLMTALKSNGRPDVLLIIWERVPYTNHIEEGGDVMIQELQRHKIQILVVDNTFVENLWMNPKMKEYLFTVWYPALVELGLKTFIYIQSVNTLGGLSYTKFNEHIRLFISTAGSRLKKPVFRYLPIKSDKNKWLNIIEDAINLTK